MIKEKRANPMIKEHDLIDRTTLMIYLYDWQYGTYANFFGNPTMVDGYVLLSDVIELIESRKSIDIDEDARVEREQVLNQGIVIGIDKARQAITDSIHERRK